MIDQLMSMAGGFVGGLIGTPGSSTNQTGTTKETNKTTSLPKEIQDMLEAITSMQVSKAMQADQQGNSQFSKEAAMGDSAATVNAFANNPDLLSLIQGNTALTGYTDAAKSKVAGDRQANLDIAAGVAGSKNTAAYASILQAIKSSEVASALALLDANKGVETTATKTTNFNKKSKTEGTGLMGLVEDVIPFLGTK